MGWHDEAVTRIIAGTLGGRRLNTPRGDATRPTADRVREALFSRLAAQDALAGAYVLDLYAGSGALGLEAASRGAASVLAVESDRDTARLIRSNVEDFKVGGIVTVRNDTVERVLAAGPGELAVAGDRDPATYELALLDPPYPLTDDVLADVLAALVDNDWLAPDATVVVERSRRAREPRWPTGLTAADARTYGDTTLHFAFAARDAASAIVDGRAEASLPPPRPE